MVDAQTQALKVPPHSLEAEQAVLGGLMLDNQAWDRVAEQLVVEDFYRREHQLIFKAMAALSHERQPFDLITLSEWLEQKAELNAIGGLAYLGELAKNTPSAANIAAYAAIVRERAVLRELVEAAGNIADAAFNPQGRPSQELLDDAESQVFRIAERRGKSNEGPRALPSLLPSTLDRIEVLSQSSGSITGLSSSFTDLDALTSGLQPSDLIIVAGRPSMGKTTLAMNIAEYASMEATKPVLVFSMEMPAESLVMRTLSSLARIDQTKIRNGKLDDDDWARLTSTMNLLGERSKLYIDDAPGLTPTDVRARARRLAREHNGLSLIVVDYLQLMRVPHISDNRVMEISEISRSLKALAKELKVPLVALSQLNRGLEQRSDRRPVMSDLRESGAIEQDADVIVFIYRDEVYNPDTPQKGIAEIIIGKQRNGPIGRVRLTFQGRYNRFDNCVSIPYEETYA